MKPLAKSSWQKIMANQTPNQTARGAVFRHPLCHKQLTAKAPPFGRQVSWVVPHSMNKAINPPKGPMKTQLCFHWAFRRIRAEHDETTGDRSQFWKVQLNKKPTP